MERAHKDQLGNGKGKDMKEGSEEGRRGTWRGGKKKGEGQYWPKLMS